MPENLHAKIKRVIVMFNNRGRVFGLIALVLAILPAVLQGEILVLKDGSELKGRIVSIQGDTLVFEPSFGGTISIHRDKIARIIYDESGERAVVPAEKKVSGSGVLKLVFDQNKLTSKVAVTQKLKSHKDEVIRANWIEQLVIVGTDTVFSRVDTTMDKTVYKGHERLYKNNVKLEDVQVPVKAGIHRCVLVVRNTGAQSHADVFDEGPLELTLSFDTVNIAPDQTTTLKVGIKKGFLRMGAPKLVAVE
jgi:hypothetical protein